MSRLFHMTSFLLLFLCFFSMGSHAQLYIEPYAGYHTGKIDFGQDRDIKGISFGGRIGVSTGSAIFGLDYMLGKWEVETSSSNVDSDARDLGIFIGLVGGKFRGYAAYLIDSENKIENSGGGDTKYEGTALKFGIGMFVSSVTVNLEYLMHTYDEADGNNLSQDVDTKMYGLTVGIPFQL